MYTYTIVYIPKAWRILYRSTMRGGCSSKLSQHVQQKTKFLWNPLNSQTHKSDFPVDPGVSPSMWRMLRLNMPAGRNVQRIQTAAPTQARVSFCKLLGSEEGQISVVSLTWKLGMCSRSRGLLTDNSPDIGSIMKIPVGGWSAPGPVTLYLRARVLSWSDRICGVKIPILIHSQTLSEYILDKQSVSPSSDITHFSLETLFNILGLNVIHINCV